jgi:beta-lactamase class A
MQLSWVDIIAASAGEYAVYSRALGTPVTLTHRADVVVEAASTIKVIILIALFDAAQAKRISLRQRVDLKRSHVGRNGSGILQSMYFNAPFTLYNLAYLMMTVSDNVATNAIIELLGYDKINAFIKTDLALKHTKLGMEKIAFERGHNLMTSPAMGHTTAREMGEVLERLVEGKLLDPYHTRLAIRMMSGILKSTFNRRLPAPKIKRYASKTGWIDYKPDKRQVLNECGIIETTAGHIYVFSVFATLPLDKQLTYSIDAPARQEFADLGRALYGALVAGRGVLKSRT